MMGPELHAIFSQNQSSKLALVVLKDELFRIFPVFKGRMNSGDRNVVGYSHIDIFFPADVDRLLLLEGDELEYLAVVFAFLLHDL
jgi:hypothetical protein